MYYGLDNLKARCQDVMSPVHADEVGRTSTTPKCQSSLMVGGNLTAGETTGQSDIRFGRRSFGIAKVHEA